MRIVLAGMLAALFFSTTFVLNRAMSLEGGHWVWSAALRYAWMLVLLAAGLGVARPRLLAATLRLYARHWRFWTLAGGVGFGLFYAGITFGASYTPGWVVAATWQTTILATPVVLWAFGRPVPWRAVALTLVIFAGVMLINVEQAAIGSWRDVLLGAAPILVAAFAYPFGNQLVWEARGGVMPTCDQNTSCVLIASAKRKRGFAWPRMGFAHGAPSWRAIPSCLLRRPLGISRRVPHLDHPAMDDPFCRVLLLTLGSVPLWVVLIAVVAPPPPAMGQVVNTGLVAVFSGVAATSIFLWARQAARTASELAAADCTQSMEVVFSLAGEVLLLGGALPGPWGWCGIALTMLGLGLYIRVQNVR